MALSLLGTYDRKFLAIGASTVIVGGLLVFVLPGISAFLTLLLSVIFWGAVILVFFQKYKERAKSFIVGMLATLVLVFFVSMIILFSISGEDPNPGNSSSDKEVQQYFRVN